MPLVFGDFALDQERRQLLREGQPVRLEPKVYELLGLLIERRPKALNKAQIRDVLWPGTFVSESALAGLVTDLRAVLDDDPRQAKYIRTVHGFGYAFCAEARSEGDGKPLELEVRPYPGLAAFTEADTAHFFGREAEVVALWEKVERQGLLAVIGPSGAGKTSFLRAGVIPRRPERWKASYATPGASPALSLARGLTPDLAGDAEAMGEMLQGVEDMARGVESDLLFSAVGRWRKGTDEVLLVLDQFEELFTLNGPEVQSRFVDLIGRLVDEAGLHVVLSLRDDFLFRCHAFPRLAPVFRDLTPLGPPSREALRRALEEPAARLGLRFEDGSLVEEMTAAVVDERGALPLLAFAVSRLWEERDREKHLLTREAYERIGGVEGALAQHAEATLGAMGPAGEPLVREILRNLVTAAGTRAVRDRDDLLSVFASDRKEAEPVLDALVAARLLTEYEAPDPEPTRVPADADRGTGAALASGPRIEVVHESLLSHWPRLTRWLAQDAEGALLRDQLRQASKLWDEKGRPEELLWTGRAYREYALWRERYAGGLSAIEDDFAREMTALAGRRRRWRRMAMAAALTTLVLGLAVVAGFWRRAETSRQRAEAEALRAEAAKLLALGQVELDAYPTAALAYAIASLDLSDTPEGRLFALRVLQAGPIARLAPAFPGDGMEAQLVDFSPNGEWLAVGGLRKVQIHHRDGRAPIVLPGYRASSNSPVMVGFDPRSSRLVTSHGGDARVWSLPEGRELSRVRIGEGWSASLFVRGEGFFASTTDGKREVFRWSPLAGGEARLVGSADALPGDIDAQGEWMAFGRDKAVFMRSLRQWTDPFRRLGQHSAEVLGLAFQPEGRSVAAIDKSGQILVWPTSAGSHRPERVLNAPGARGVGYSPGGRWLGAFGDPEAFLARVWDLTAPPGAMALEPRSNTPALISWAFDRSERWLATGDTVDVALWPLDHAYQRVLPGHEEFIHQLLFTPDGAELLSSSYDGTVRAWSLRAGAPSASRTLLRTPTLWPTMAVDWVRGRMVVAAQPGRVVLVPLAEGPPRELEAFSKNSIVQAVAFSPDGGRIASATQFGPSRDKVIRITDLERRSTRVIGPLPGADDGSAGGINFLTFLDQDRILASAYFRPISQPMVFDLRDGSLHRLSSARIYLTFISRTKHFGLGLLEPEMGGSGPLARLAFDEDVPTKLPTHGSKVSIATMDPTETLLATGSEDGTVRIGPASGGEPHVFFGHKGNVFSVAFSPDGRWLASGGEDLKIRLWPVPDVTKSPMHTLPHDELLRRLRTFTNLRAVRDPLAATGYKLEIGPFPGWATTPEW